MPPEGIGKKLETETQLRVDAAIVSADGPKATETTTRRSRLSEQARSDVADRIAQVRVVQQVLKVD